MNFLLHTLYSVSVSPASAFASLAHTPSFGSSVALLTALSVLFGVGMLSAEQMRYRVSPSRELTKSTLLSNLVVFGLVFPGIWFWATFVTQSLLRWFAVAADFETLFALLVVAALPQFLGWFAAPIRNINRNGHYAWQVGMIALQLWTTVLVLLAINRAYGVEGWRLLVAGFPIPALLWAATIASCVEKPDALSAACKWQKTRGEHVIVFAPPNVSPAETVEIAHGCDDALLRVARLLEVDIPAFRVGVFLFASAEEHKRAANITRTLMGGYAHSDSITLRYSKWESLRGTIAHEFAHVLREQRITRNPAAILDEGLAEYVKETLFANTAHVPRMTLPHNLRVLANNAVFYSWLYAEQPDYSSHDYYSHAHGFVRFVIQRSGMAAFKQLMRETARDKSEDVGERLANAVRKVYGVSLSALESEWRRARHANE